jgi:hypothetical protein
MRETLPKVYFVFNHKAEVLLGIETLASSCGVGARNQTCENHNKNDHKKWLE